MMKSALFLLALATVVERKPLQSAGAASSGASVDLRVRSVILSSKVNSWNWGGTSGGKSERRRNGARACHAS